MNETIGIPLGTVAGLAIQSFIRYRDDSLTPEWLFGCAVMFICSLVMWAVVRRASKKMSRGK